MTNKEIDALAEKIHIIAYLSKAEAKTIARFLSESGCLESIDYIGEGYDRGQTAAHNIAVSELIGGDDGD